MRVLLVPFGSAGDVYPFVGLGAELARRGHRVTVLASGYYRELVAHAGLEFAAYVLQKNDNNLILEADLWHPTRWLRVLATRGVLPTIPVVHRLISRHYRAGDTAVVAHSFALGARIAAETLDLPFTTVHLQPIVFRSRYSPPVHPGATWIRSMPVALRPAAFRLLDVFLDRMYAGPLNVFRSKFNLAPVTRVFDKWWHAPESTLAFFPEWFAPPQPDWPAHVRCCGFPLYDGSINEASDFDVRAYLADGEPPIVFTSGSRMAKGQDFFAVSAAACTRLGRRALFITRFPDRLPSPLPTLARHVNYAPLSELLPGAAALVHHGGIGTAALALRAGTPQLVAPSTHDHFDNAAHIERLGVSITLPPRRYVAGSVAAALRRLLEEPDVRRNCTARANGFGATNALATAADTLEEYWRLRQARGNVAYAV
jgi:UDP:flavonoid glycosyltransferase YjiC (YdhE family)